MSSRWNQGRTVIEEPAASAEVDELRKRIYRFDEAYEALQWLLARNCPVPFSVPVLVDGQHFFVYSQKADRYAKTPRIAVVYSCDETTSHIYGVKVG